MHLQPAILLSSLLLAGNFFLDTLPESVLFCRGARVFDFACVFACVPVQGASGCDGVCSGGRRRRTFLCLQ